MQDRLLIRRARRLAVHEEGPSALIQNRIRNCRSGAWFSSAGALMRAKLAAGEKLRPEDWLF